VAALEQRRARGLHRRQLARSRQRPAAAGRRPGQHRDWFKQIDPALLKRLDFVLADTMIMGVTPEGKPRRLWLPASPSTTPRPG
jgi:hypothetical protein